MGDDGEWMAGVNIGVCVRHALFGQNGEGMLRDDAYVEKFKKQKMSLSFVKIRGIIYHYGLS